MHKKDIGTGSRSDIVNNIDVIKKRRGSIHKMSIVFGNNFNRERL